MTEQTPTRNIKLIIAYNGRAYHGWQRQAKGISTVQQEIEDVATRIMGHRVILHGAGRTDAGVHADGQVANFHTDNQSIPLRGLRRAINSKLPADILIRSATIADDQFQASISAVGKTYRYRLFVGPDRSVGLAGQVYHYRWHVLDIERMVRAGHRLCGTHDFRGLATSAEKRDNTVRTIYRCEVASVGQEIHITVQGNGFLYNMVRNIVGTLIDVGRGRWDEGQIDTIFSTLDRKEAGPTVPPDGLSMVCVHYDDSGK
jgi:tRNA pseudouridine38-40 synthase